jgi:hypothetical protein
MGFREISNSGLLYTLVIIGLAYIIFYAAVFLRKSYKRCIELGFSKEKVNNVIKSSLAFTVVPSIAIVVGFFSLAAVLGIPWPWWRLSVIGSVGYELMAADIASKGMQFTSLAAMAEANDPSVFVSIMIVMTVGILGGLTALLIFGKRFTTKLMQAREKKENTWGILMNACFMLTLLAVFIPIMIITDKISALTLFTSAVITLLLGIIIKKFRVYWLGNFVLAITLILSMAASVGWQALLN